MFSFVRNYTQLSFKIFFAFFRTLKLISIVLSRPPQCLEGFPSGSDGKESACNARDPCSILGLRRSTGEGINYPLQYSWASLMAKQVKNPLSMRETWVQSLDWEDPLEKGTATHSSILAWRIPWTEEPGRLCSPLGCKELDETEQLSLSRF